VLAGIILTLCDKDGGFCPYPGMNEVIGHYNRELAEMAQRRISQGDSIVVVDMAEAGLAYTLDGQDMSDPLHLTRQGYAKMAPMWLQALNELLGLPTHMVELISFQAFEDQVGIALNWSTAWEKESSHFEVERKQEEGAFSKIAIMSGAGNSSQPLGYTYTDRKPPLGRVYYRLKQVDVSGHYTYSKVTSAVHNPAAQEVLYPNPNRGRAVFLHATGYPPGEQLHIAVADLVGKNVLTCRGQADITGRSCLAFMF